MIEDFIEKITSDHRITTAHISIYLSLWNKWRETGSKTVVFFSHDIMQICKISSDSTFHKRIRELHDFGYIEYHPSFNHFEGSRVKIIALSNEPDK